jgi:hypothetical protein
VKEKLVRHRLAGLAHRLAVVAGRRQAAVGTEHFRRLDEVVAVLADDYASAADPASSGAGDPDRLAGLIDLFGLDQLEARLLTVGVAPDLDSTFGLAYDLLTGASGGRPTVALALELGEIASADAAGFAALGPAGRLRRAGLLEVVGDGIWLRRPLRVPDRVSAQLAGADDLDPAVAAAVVDALPFGHPVAAELARAVAAGQPLIWLRTVLGTAGPSVAVAAFAEVGLGALVVDARRLGGISEPVDTLRRAAFEAAVSGCGLVVVAAERLAEGGPRPAVAALASLNVPVVAVGDRAWNAVWSRHVPLCVDAPLLNAADREAVWSAALGPIGADDGAPVTTMRFTPEDIAATSQYARVLSRARGAELSVELVRDAARALSTGAGAGAGSGRIAARAATEPATFADLVLPDRVVGDLRRLADWAAHRDDVLTRGPVHGKAGKGSGITALFTGSPGTGKTLAAHVIADELNLELFQVDLSAVVDKYIGETEKNLERVFHDAERHNVVLFFDEADALFGSRSEVKDARDRYANQEVSYLLQRMEHFDGITVLATNLRGNLDAAFSRRLQFIIHFPDPDAPTRRRLWQQHLANAGDLDAADPVDLDLLAETIELAGGDIRNVVLAATYDAAIESAAVGMRHVRAATAREYLKLGRRLPSAGF